VGVVSTTASVYRRVASPLTTDATAPLPTDCKGIKLDQPLADHEYRQLAALLEDQPDKELFVLQLDSTHQEPITNLRFLQFFPQLRIFAGTLELLQSLDGIEHLQQAHTIVLHKANHRMSAAPLAPLTALRDLWLDGQFTDREAIRNLSGVTNFKMGYAAKTPI
jgi:hypothetical protein